MFGRAYKVGTILGFRIEISVTFLILLGFILISNGLSHGLAGVVGGLLMVTVLFGSVLLHELGHAVVARRYGLRILGIELHFVGGAAKMAEPPRTAREEIVVAAAGPITSFALAAGAYVLALGTGFRLFSLLALVNVMLGAFNLVPALPMDGGRVLRAVLAGRMGRFQATLTAANVAQGVALAMILLGILQGIRPVLFIAGAPLSGFGLILVGFLVWIMAAQERAMAGRWRYADEAPSPEVLGPNGEVLFGAGAGGPTPQAGWPPAAGPVPSPGVPTRRTIYRLPNGQVVVVEEYVRW